MNLLTFIILGLFLLFIEGCEYGDARLTLVNNSNDTVYYSTSLKLDSIESFPIVYNNTWTDYLYSNILEPDEVYHSPILSNWEYVINNNAADSTIKVFFFTKDLIETIGKDSIMKHQLYSKKEKLTVQDLKKVNWRVTYP